MRKGWEMELVSLENRRLRGILQMWVNIWWEGESKTESGSFQWCPVIHKVTIGKNWSAGGLVWTQENIFLLCSWLSTGTGGPERLWSPPSLERLKAIWMQSLATCSSWPCLTRLAGPDVSQWCLPIRMFLWLCAFQQNSFSHSIGLVQVYSPNFHNFWNLYSARVFSFPFKVIRKYIYETCTLGINFVFSTDR